MVIRHQDRLEYYDTLQAANEGDTRPFVRFISHCTEKTLDVYLWATRDASRAIDQEAETSRGLDTKASRRLETKAIGSDDTSRSLESKISRRLESTSSIHKQLPVDEPTETSLREVEEDNLLSHQYSEDELLEKLLNDPMEELLSHDSSLDTEFEDNTHLKYDLTEQELESQEQSEQMFDSENSKDSLHRSQLNDETDESKEFKAKPWKLTVDDQKLMENARLDLLDHLRSEEERQESASTGNDGSGGTPHKWLSGGDHGGEYQRSSRYYSRLYLSPIVPNDSREDIGPAQHGEL